MSNMMREKVLSVHHWNDTLFSFTTTRDPGFRFKSGHFIMIGLEQEGRPLMRAYSIASPHYEETLEFFSIKVPDGPLTSKLQKIQVGDEIMMSKKPTGTLVLDHLIPGRNLWLLSTGTGLAPFMSIIRDPETYEQYDRVIVTHGVRFLSELAYADLITRELPENEFFGEAVREKLIYFPTVTREPFRNQGRLTDLLASGELEQKCGLPRVNLDNDRFMLCGSPSMLKDFCTILDGMGFQEARHGDQGHYVIERAFVEK
jgi:ferredoxin--NADP+ reductase